MQKSKLVYQIDQEQPLTALDFFEARRSTLTAIISAILTYVVILVQFNQSIASETTEKTANMSIAVNE